LQTQVIAPYVEKLREACGSKVCEPNWTGERHAKNPEEVFNRVKYYVKVGGGNGSLWLYLCNIEPGTPMENIKAAVDAVHKYGTY